MIEIEPDFTSVETKERNILNKVYVTVQDDKEEKSTFFTKFNFTISIIIKLLGIIIILYGIILIIGIIELANKHGSPVNEKTKEFNYLTASQFKDHTYYGKNDLFLYYISKMTKIIDMSEKLSHTDLLNSLTCEKRNFLMWGSPGTGKTQFVKVLIWKLNENLCKKYNVNKDLVRAYFITPSSIENKYKGETERKIKALFDEARNDKDWKATFIFIDEIDAFFGDRNTQTNDYQTSSKTEFLNILSGINDDISKNIFVIGATNRHHAIDDAFKRRMGDDKEFKLPDRNEIERMLVEITKKWHKNDNYQMYFDSAVDKLNNYNYSQAKITAKCSDVVFNHTIECKNLYEKLAECIIPLDRPSTNEREEYDQSFVY